MRWLSTSKSLRWLMATSVSVWMAGAACIFGCSNGTVTPGNTDTASVSSETVVAANSCASMRSHDCCSKQKRASRPTTQPAALPSLVPLPGGMMENCPMAVNATAVVSKMGSDVSQVGLVRAVWSSQVLTSSDISNSHFVSTVPASRGPTYLRCCVFLI